MASSKPKVRVLATGGSIASLGPHRLDYTVYPELGRHMTIQESLARIPEVSRFAAMESEDIRSVGSTAIGPSDWLELTRRINKTFEEDPSVAGVVVSHGTATLEETAFFLHLTVKSTRPVVVTAAMRPPTSLSTDADANLLDAIRVAACPEASGMGVLTVLNTEIHSARETTKADTFRVQTFKPDELGYLGYADPDGEVVFYRAPLRKHTTATPFDVTGLDTVPRVDIVYTYAGADGLLVDVVRRNRSDGLVVAGFGGGHYPDAVDDAAALAVKEGIAVVMASRASAGRVMMTPAKEGKGFIVPDNLPPPKARILLMLGLTLSRDRHELQRMFWEC